MANEFLIQGWPQISLLAGVFSSQPEIKILFKINGAHVWAPSQGERQLYNFKKQVALPVGKTRLQGLKQILATRAHFPHRQAGEALGRQPHESSSHAPYLSWWINQEKHGSPSPYNKYWQVLSSDNSKWRIVESTSANKTGGTKTETTSKHEIIFQHQETFKTHRLAQRICSCHQVNELPSRFYLSWTKPNTHN